MSVNIFGTPAGGGSGLANYTTSQYTSGTINGSGFALIFPKYDATFGISSTLSDSASTGNKVNMNSTGNSAITISIDGISVTFSGSRSTGGGSSVAQRAGGTGISDCPPTAIPFTQSFSVTSNSSTYNKIIIYLENS